MPVVMAATTETMVMEKTSQIAETLGLSIVVEFTYGPTTPHHPSPITLTLTPILTLSVLTECVSGGLEMLFSDQRRHELSMPAIDKNSKPVTIAYLVEYLCENTMKDTRKELFVLDHHV